MRLPTTYIVSGFMRTGTSMMMACLAAAGLDAVYNPVRDKMNKQFGDDKYVPNPGGFYELTAADFKDRMFPTKYKGKLIKILYAGLPRCCVGNYQVVFMLRDPEEIRQSFEAFFENGDHTHFRNRIKTYHEDMEEAIARLRNRKDTTVTVLHYRDVVNDPFWAFSLLKESGWPIDVDKAAAVVDPSQCRFKLEELEIGI